jgi:hypothetical protein
VDRVGDRAAGRVVVPAVDRVAVRVGDRVADRVADRAVVPPVDRAAGQVVVPVVDRVADPAAAPGVARAADLAAARAADPVAARDPRALYPVASTQCVSETWRNKTCPQNPAQVRLRRSSKPSW